jgi:phosphatidylglycerophosphate synthase
MTPVPSPATAPLAGVVLVDDSPGWAETVCGLSVLTRAIAALDRAGAAVFLPFADRADPALLARVRAELARMPRRPDVRFGQAPPAASRLAIVTAPGVFDYRILARACEAGAAAVVAFGRPGASVFLWMVAAARADGLMTERADGATVAGRLAAAREAVVDPGEGLCDALGESPPAAIVDKLFRQARKSSDTWVARHIDRPISLAVTRRLVPHPVSPNQITVVATLIGLAGAVLLGFGTYASQLAGAFLVTLAIIVDGCDGEVARIKFMESEFGRKLDFFLDNVVNVAAIFAVGAGYAWQTGETPYLVASTIAAVAAAASVAPVYLLFFREQKQAVQLGAPAAPPQEASLAALVEAIAGRDFAYLILVLALFGRAHWFAPVCVAGIMVFLAAVLVVQIRSARRPTAGL